MLYCVYHPTEEMRVVETEERDRLVALGVWFNSPLPAKALREKVENDIKLKESKDEKPSDEQQCIREKGSKRNESEDGRQTSVA